MAAPADATHSLDKVDTPQSMYTLLRSWIPDLMHEETLPKLPPKQPMPYYSMLSVLWVMLGAVVQHASESMRSVAGRALLRFNVILGFATLPSSDKHAYRRNVEDAANAALSQSARQHKYFALFEHVYKKDARHSENAFYIYRNTGYVAVTTPSGYAIHRAYADLISSVYRPSTWAFPYTPSDRLCLLRFYNKDRAHNHWWLNASQGKRLDFDADDLLGELMSANTLQAAEVVLDFSELVDAFSHEARDERWSEKIGGWYATVARNTTAKARLILVLPANTIRDRAWTLTMGCNAVGSTSEALGALCTPAPRSMDFSYELVVCEDSAAVDERLLRTRIESSGACVVLCDTSLARAKKTTKLSEVDALKLSVPLSEFKRTVYMRYVDFNAGILFTKSGIRIVHGGDHPNPKRETEFVKSADFLHYCMTELTEFERGVPVLVLLSKDKSRDTVAWFLESLQRKIVSVDPSQKFVESESTKKKKKKLIFSDEAEKQERGAISTWHAQYTSKRPYALLEHPLDLRTMLFEPTASFDSGGQLRVDMNVSPFDAIEEASLFKVRSEARSPADIALDYTAMFGTRYQTMRANFTSALAKEGVQDPGWVASKRVSLCLFKCIEIVRAQLEKVIIARNDYKRYHHDTARADAIFMARWVRAAELMNESKSALYDLDEVRKLGVGRHEVFDFLSQVLGLCCDAVVCDPPLGLDETTSSIGPGYEDSTEKTAKHTLRLYPALVRRYYFKPEMRVVVAGKRIVQAPV